MARPRVVAPDPGPGHCRLLLGLALLPAPTGLDLRGGSQAHLQVIAGRRHHPWNGSSSKPCSWLLDRRSTTGWPNPPPDRRDDHLLLQLPGVAGPPPGPAQVLAQPLFWEFRPAASTTRRLQALPLKRQPRRSCAPRAAEAARIQPPACSAGTGAFPPALRLSPSEERVPCHTLDTSARVFFVRLNTTL